MKVAVMALLLYLALGIQAALSLPFDLPLVLVSLASLSFPRVGASGYGFAAGALQGALAGANLTGYAISRTLAGFLQSTVAGLGFQPSYVVAGVAAAATTLFSQIVLMFVSPPTSIPRFLGDTIAMAVYNGVIAIPLYGLLRKLLSPPSV